jgi:hypothetical protein
MEKAAAYSKLLLTVYEFEFKTIKSTFSFLQEVKTVITKVKRSSFFMSLCKLNMLNTSTKIVMEF